MAEDPIDPDSLPPQDSQAHSEAESSFEEAKDAQISRMAGCAKLGGCLLKIALLLLIVGGIYRCSPILSSGGHYSPAKSIMKDLQVATGHFRTEYNRFPLPMPIDDKADMTLRSRGAWIAALLGEEDSLNPRKIKFIDLPQARDGKRGLLKEGSEQVLVDPWGEPLYVIMDTNLDNRIIDPEDAAKLLHGTVFIYSSGPDRDPKTWEDNVCSWR